MLKKMEVVWMIVIAIIVFLVVFFVAWGLRVRPLTAIALASVWSLLIMAILFPTGVPQFDTFTFTGWWTVWAILIAFFYIYIIFYINFMASKDQDPKMIEEELSMEVDI